MSDQAREKRRLVNDFDGAQSRLSSLTFEAARVGLLTEALVKARTGSLTPDWRDHITISRRPVGQPYQDAMDIAVRTVLIADRADWEPGVAGDWRKALNAWYFACLVNMNDAIDVQLEQRRSTRRTRTQSLILAHQATLLPADQRQSHVESILSHDAKFDSAAATSLGAEVRDRDRLHAWYRASLVVGGDANDWMDWYRCRVANWGFCSYLGDLTFSRD
jgi:hypothetical protein